MQRGTLLLTQRACWDRAAKPSPAAGPLPVGPDLGSMASAYTCSERSKDHSSESFEVSSNNVDAEAGAVIWSGSRCHQEAVIAVGLQSDGCRGCRADRPACEESESEA
ncbi:hypothetical protein EYF80_027693 [Liparis tanakae]|uniref:Uncharacterized protein n=1 Tax=Liparis tanakae TaxID=230148 RepID=A0A4Z2H918_9TELE|nr:hypothetical protein EYF80_027693 [Liparis tanakae]